MSTQRSVQISFRASILGATLFFALPAIVATPSAWGQSQSINGTIRGSITDATGAPISEATVIVKNLDTGYTRQVTAEGDGLYVAPNLPTGVYS
ncbi:MAG TPA: carboxypeptidase-like regulatory domain-containing protein, partial [Edaphobacter sp.]|nr:carboxypeptidase-like regulatory domain-containing protein [Edaphobacter sp.]